ncbi:MAG: hypothetical protein B0W54_11505 [Cellvibrio sp. 79]|nr:MAG: hypothetical protein B0W54_11505 [Cellvibrio sp. 79]
MSAKQLWVLSLKAKVLENCELDNDGSEFQYVESFLLTDDSNELLTQTNITLGQMGLELDNKIKLVVYKSKEWSGGNDPIGSELLQEAAERAIATEELTFGPFTSCNFMNE